jgi:hypothetical protein
MARAQSRAPARLMATMTYLIDAAQPPRITRPPLRAVARHATSLAVPHRNHQGGRRQAIRTKPGFGGHPHPAPAPRHETALCLAGGLFDGLRRRGALREKLVARPGPARFLTAPPRRPATAGPGGSAGAPGRGASRVRRTETCSRRPHVLVLPMSLVRAAPWRRPSAQAEPGLGENRCALPGAVALRVAGSTPHR